MIVSLVLFLFLTQSLNGLISPITPFTNYNHSVELQTNIADIFWTVDEINQTILFELHVKTTGWIALGISPAGGMNGADIGVGWIDLAGKVYFQDRYAITRALPVIDNTTTDWYGLQGREQDGWTAIQFSRLLDTCDSMDVPIKSGTNYLIFAYGLVDPSLSPPVTDITYHYTRRGQVILSLRGYTDPPLESKFAQLDYFDFRLNNYSIPANDTTYYCKVHRVPANYSTKRHAIAHKFIIDSTESERVHHLLMYECDPRAQFNDSNLPAGICDDILSQIMYCSANIATAWAVGGQQILEFPAVAGYPIGGDFSIKYYLVQMHYDNPSLCNNCTDNSGIRFYVANELRQYDLGYLTFGTGDNPTSLSIPPQVDNFLVDAYCPANATAVIPSDGITLFTAFPHTHLQGKSLWTKLIRNKTAVDYLFNAESYDFNYQFIQYLPKTTQIFPGDEFVTRCVYNTMNKNTVTFGGESTREEMCLHMFAYYPRVNNLSVCLSNIHPLAWRNFLKVNYTLNATNFAPIVRNISWTPNLTVQWQNFYNTAARYTVYGRSDSLNIVLQPKMPEYVDLRQKNCTVKQISIIQQILHFHIIQQKQHFHIVQP